MLTYRSSSLSSLIIIIITYHYHHHLSSSSSSSSSPLSIITNTSIIIIIIITYHHNNHHLHHHQLGWSSSISYFFLYWMPIPIEFGSFLLLPLYFAHVLYPEAIKSCWNYLRIGYIVVIFGLLSCQAIYILLSLLYNVSYRYFISPLLSS